MAVDIHEAARGHWRGILAHYGLDQKVLSGKHCACPMCGGKDRFRFDNKEGRGTWYCNHCGAGNGVDLVMGLRGIQFKDAVSDIRPLVGGSEPEKQQQGMSGGDQRKMRMEIWGGTQRVEKGDDVDRYLAGRGVALDQYPGTLRLHPSLRYAYGQNFPGMVAAIQSDTGTCVCLHRTFLTDGEKAPVDVPRKVTPGELPEGSAVRLSYAAPIMGVAEGIETALAAAKRFNVPVWATTNERLLSAWVPPIEVRELLVFGDNDASFVGQAAAYQLAKRLSPKIKTHVLIPEQVGTDWADHISRKDH